MGGCAYHVPEAPCAGVGALNEARGRIQRDKRGQVCLPWAARAERAKESPSWTNSGTADPGMRDRRGG